MPTVYFAASISGGREDVAIYAELLAVLRRHATVLTEHVGSAVLAASGEEGIGDREIHDRDLAWLAAADAVVAEVTVPSLGVGYEIARALALGKPVLCAVREIPGRRLSAMIAGAPGVEVVTYSDPTDLDSALAGFFA